MAHNLGSRVHGTMCSLALLESISLEESEPIGRPGVPGGGDQGDWPTQEEGGHWVELEGFVLK